MRSAAAGDGGGDGWVDLDRGAPGAQEGEGGWGVGGGQGSKNWVGNL